MILALLLLVALGAVLVLVVWYRRNAARAAAGYPAWSTYRAPDPNAVQPGDGWYDDNGSTWNFSDDGDTHAAVDGGSVGGDIGGGHGDS